MHDPHRGWDRYQWVGETQRAPAGSAQPEQFSDHIEWNLGQWVGQGQGLSAGKHIRPSAHDSRSGFSGMGHPDTGGQRWATGYLRLEADAAEPEALPLEDEAVA